MSSELVSLDPEHDYLACMSILTVISDCTGVAIILCTVRWLMVLELGQGHFWQPCNLFQ